MSTLASLSKGQTFTLTEPGHKFEGRTLTVKSIGTTGHTLLAVDPVDGHSVYLYRTPARVEVLEPSTTA